MATIGNCFWLIGHWLIKKTIDWAIYFTAAGAPIACHRKNMGNWDEKSFICWRWCSITVNCTHAHRAECYHLMDLCRSQGREIHNRWHLRSSACNTNSPAAHTTMHLIFLLIKNCTTKSQRRPQSTLQCQHDPSSDFVHTPRGMLLLVTNNVIQLRFQFMFFVSTVWDLITHLTMTLLCLCCLLQLATARYTKIIAVYVAVCCCHVPFACDMI